MGQENDVNSHVVAGLEVAGLDGETYCDLPDTYTEECIPVHKGNIQGRNDLLKWLYLKAIHLPQIDSEVKLLIGTMYQGHWNHYKSSVLRMMDPMPLRLCWVRLLMDHWEETVVMAWML